MELGDAESIGVEDHHHRHVGDIDTHLDHGRRDEDVEGTSTEAFHHLLLLCRPQPSVQETEAQPGQLVGGEAGEGLLGRRRFQLLGVLDQRADNVCLVARSNLGPHSVHANC